jgi:TonB-linked SusC/RagA family outer membrane protein
MKKILFLMLLFSSFTLLYAQERVVKGVVTDEADTPIPGVSVSVKGLSVGTATNVDGTYTLKLPASATAISYSFIGYNTQVVKFSGKLVINVKMEPSAISLGETVVVAYGSQKKANMTGAISSISSKDLLKTPVANMATALIGRTPGLTTYQKSGQPGADGISLRIRGIETVNGSEPLILVDGVERDFTQLDPNEIETISVLKDAASTAVFGVRGANGVMIITTKKGEEGPAKVSITSNFSIQEPTRIPKMIGAETFCRMYNEAQLNDVPSAIPRFSEADIQKYAGNENPLEYPNNDWYNLMLKPSALQQQHNITISGGTKTTKYYTSVGYLTQEGLMKDYSSILDRSLNNNYKYDRFNLRSNIDVDVTPTTKVGVMISGIIAKTNDPGFNWTTLISSTPLSYPLIYDDKIITSTVNFAGSPLMSAVGTSLSQKNANTIALTLNLNQKLDFITKGLSLRGMASYDSYYAHTISRTQGYITYRVEYLPNEAGNNVLQLQPSGEKYLVSNPGDSWNRNRKIHGEAALEYKRSFGNHNLYGLVLTTLDKKWYSTDAAKDMYYYVPVSYMGVVSRLTYDFKSKYMLEFNAGYNGSEAFPADKRFAWFPAFSAGWNLAEEEFVKDNVSQDILSKFKIRGSYGIVGNDGTANGIRFLYYSGEYKTSSGAMFGDVTPTARGGLLEGKLGNSTITWETATKKNIGVELSLFKNKLTFNADVFKSDRENILLSANSTPYHVVIFSSADYFNIGRVTNHGFELEAKWRQDFGKFSYFIGGNYSFSRNKWIEKDEVKDANNPNLWTTGRRIGENFGLISDGFYNNADELARGPIIGTPTIGNARYIDVNGDGIVSELDKVPIGNPEFPEVSYGINLGTSYKGFEISALFQGATNTSKMMTGKFQKPFDVNGGMMEFVVPERWSPSNIDNAIRPKLTLAYNNANDYTSSTMWMRDGSYLRLRNIEVSYRFEPRIIRKVLGLTGLRLYANGQNLFTWDKLKVIDPEGDLADSWKYPQLKTYNLGLKVDF